MMYLPSNPIVELLRGLFKRRIGDATLGYLGDSHGEGARVDVPGMAGYVYVHFPNGKDANGFARYSEPTIARSGNAAYLNYPGAGVYVGYGYDGDLEIKSAQYRTLDAAGINTATLNPLNQQSKFVYEWQLTYGLASPVGNTAEPSTLVTVKSFRHYVGDVFQTFDTPLEADKIDLAAYIPAADLHCYAAIWVDTYTNTAEITTSTPQAITTPLDETDVQELVAGRPPDAMPFKAFRLANAQEGITQNPVNETSLRQHMATPHLWGFPNTLTQRERVWPNRTLVAGPYTTSGDGDLDLESGAQVIIVHKNNFVGMAAPDADNDEDEGYSVGSLWYDLSTGILYVAEDVTDGAAVWNAVAGSGGGMDSFTVSGDAGAPFDVDSVDNNVAFTGGDAIGTDTSTPGEVLISVLDGGITEGKIADDAVTEDKIPDSSIPLYKFAPGAGAMGGPGGSVIGYDGNGNAAEIPNAVDKPVIWGENVSDGALVYLKADDKWWLADADAFLMSNQRGFVIAASGTTVANNPGVVRVSGRVDNFSTLTNGDPIYLANTPGAYTQTQPSPSLGGSTILSAQFGYALSADAAFAERLPVQYMRRASLANNATLTLTHHADTALSKRKVYAMISSNDVAVIETSGGAQDSAKQLRGQSGAGALITVDTAGVTDTGIGNASGNQLKDAQSFTVVTAGQLSQVTFFLNPNTGSPTGDLIVSVRDNNVSVPALTSLWSTTHTPTVNANNTINITNGPFLLPSGVYWLVLECATSQTLNNRFNVRRSTINPYAGGEMKVDSSASPGSWNIIAAGSDMRCTVTTAAVVTNDGLAQGFSHSSTTTVPYIDVLLQRTGTLSGNLTLAIYSDTGGMPNAVITNGTAGTVAASSVTTSYTLIRFTFSTPPTITASTQYHIVLTTSDSASNTAYVEWGIDQSSPPYANGAFAQLQSAAWGASSPAADGLFDVYGIVTTFGEPAVVGRWSGGTRDLAVRYDDGSGANPTTNTTFKNTSGVTLDVTCIVEMP